VQRGEAVQDSILHTVAADVYGWLKVWEYYYNMTKYVPKNIILGKESEHFDV